MSVYAIADLHLSHGADKPMDVFGAKWAGHTEKIAENWKKIVSGSDTVVIPGDISWGMDMDGAVEDLSYIDSLPGRKIILKGNHDYWWMSMKKLREYKRISGAESIDFLFNNAYIADNLIVCGTRGWISESDADDDGRKIILREAGRLTLSLAAAEKLKAENPSASAAVFLHYPPNAAIAGVLRSNGITHCVCGHLHGIQPGRAPAEVEGISVRLVSADYIGFTPVKIF